MKVVSIVSHFHAMMTSGATSPFGGNQVTLVKTTERYAHLDLSGARRVILGEVEELRKKEGRNK
jgi:hypothetical protein